MFEAVRAEYGPELPLLHDGHHRMTPIQAAKLGKSLEPYDLFWLEDCTPAENQAGLRLVRQHTTTPLALGEVFNTVWDYQTLITEQLIDYVRSAVTHTGGITPLRKLLDFAAMYQIKSGIHGPTDISPIGMAAALHLGLAIHNFGIQEYMEPQRADADRLPTSYRFEDGLLHPGDRPGLGVEIDLRPRRPSPTRRRICRSTGCARRNGARLVIAPLDRVLAGIGAALAWALSSLCSSRSSRMADPRAVVAGMMLVGLLICGPLAAAEGVPAGLHGSAWVWLALAAAATSRA